MEDKGEPSLVKAAAAGLVASVAFCIGVALFAIVSAGVLIDRMSRELARPSDGYVEVFDSGVDSPSGPKVVRIDLVGEIGPSAPGPLDDLLGGVLSADDRGNGVFERARGHIRLATEDEDVKGLYLFIDTPGGDLTDSDLLWHDVMLFKARKPGRFVFVHAGAQCCSGGYYVAAAADCIMALPTSETGAIGVMSDYGFNASALAEKLGVTSMVVATGANKDTMNPLKPVDAKQEAIERALLESQFARFVQVVAKGRKMSPEKVRELADGRAYAAPDALKRGLVDCLGYEEDALARISEMAGAPAYVVAYELPPESALARFLKYIGGSHANRSPRRRGARPRGTVARRR